MSIFDEQLCSHYKKTVETSSHEDDVYGESQSFSNPTWPEDLAN